VLTLLRNDPELLAIADAIAATQLSDAHDAANAKTVETGRSAKASAAPE